MAKTIPMVGEAFLGDNPYVLKVLKFRCSSASTDDATVSSVSSDAAIDLVSLPAGCVVHDFGWFVETAFAAGTTIAFGDSDNTSGYAAATDVGATTADSEIAWSSRVLMVSSDHVASDCPAYGRSRLYGTDNAIEIAFDNTGATAAAGTINIFVAYSLVGTGVTQAT